MSRFALLLSFCIFLSGCKSGNLKNPPAPASEKDSVKFAQGFSITSEDDITITVHNPWQHAKNVSFSYIFSSDIQSSQRIDDNTWRIKTPVKRVICLSTTHIGFIEWLNHTGSVVGVSGRDYVVNKVLREAMAAGRVFDVGYDDNLNIEQILKLKPDVVFAYGVNASVTNTVNKLGELGIPVVLIGEYLEQHPLAKLEWAKVFASCYGLYDTVTQKFDSAIYRYNHLVATASNTASKPKVLMGLPWQGTWFVSGSKSFTARLINDAGGEYIFNYLDFNESRPLGLEKIYESALRADYWINPGEARSINEIIAVDPRFATLPPIVNNRVFNNDNYMAASGNAIFEQGVTEPDIILADLIRILHPQLLPSHNLKYYRKLQ